MARLLVVLATVVVALLAQGSLVQGHVDCADCDRFVVGLSHAASAGHVQQVNALKLCSQFDDLEDACTEAIQTHGVATLADMLVTSPHSLCEHVESCNSEDEDEEGDNVDDEEGEDDDVLLDTGDSDREDEDVMVVDDSQEGDASREEEGDEEADEENDDDDSNDDEDDSNDDENDDEDDDDDDDDDEHENNEQHAQMMQAAKEAYLQLEGQSGSAANLNHMQQVAAQQTPAGQTSADERPPILGQPADRISPGNYEALRQQLMLNKMTLLTARMSHMYDQDRNHILEHMDDDIDNSQRQSSGYMGIMHDPNGDAPSTKYLLENPNPVEAGDDGTTKAMEGMQNVLYKSLSGPF